jgi:CRP/FNR family transcriptional regulator, cyclic AMP receptor protein
MVAGGNVLGQESRDSDSRWARGSLLALLPEAQRQIVMRLGRIRQFPTGEFMLSQGDLSDFVIVIRDGYVKITAVTEDGAESLLAIRTAGDVIGELAAMDGLPRSATARAADAVVAQVISKRDLDRCLREQPDIARAFNQAVATKLRMATQRRVDFRRDTRTRLAQVLVDLYYSSPGSEDNGTIAIRATQSELAGLIGASEPAVHKAFRALRDAGAVDTGYAKQVICGIETLRQIAEGRAAPPPGGLTPRRAEQNLGHREPGLRIPTTSATPSPQDAVTRVYRWRAGADDD